MPYKQHFTADLNPIARQTKLLLFEGSVFKNSNMNVRGAASAVHPPLPFPPSFPLTAVSQLQMLMKGSWGMGPSLSCHQSLPIRPTLEKQLWGVERQMCKHKHHCLQHYPDEWQWFWTPYHCTVIEMIEGRQVRSSCSPIARSFIRVFFLKINEKHLQWFCWTVGDTYLGHMMRGL